MNRTFSLALGGLLLAAAGLVHADPFYLDPGVDYDPTGTDQACPTCSSVKAGATIRSRWSSVVTDVDSNGTFSVGDTVKTVAGFPLTGSLAQNLVTSLQPGQIFNSQSDNGLNTNYYLTLGFNLTGQVSGVAVNGLPVVDYTAGLIEFFLYDGTNKINFMDVVLTSGVDATLHGTVDFTNVDSLTYANLFHLAGASCNGSSGFYDLWLRCGARIDVNWALGFNPNFDVTVTANADGTLTVSGLYDGSMSFVNANAVPEPASLSLAALGLLAAVGVTRRRAVKR